MAGARLAVLRLSLRGQPKSFLRTFVSLLFGHLDLAVYDGRPAEFWKLAILGLQAICWKG